MSNIDKRGILETHPFSYKVTKEKVLVYYGHKLIKTVKGNKGRALAEDLECCDEFEAQLILAKLTGNFKRGNEKDSKRKYR